jgi:hypothetical protein
MSETLERAVEAALDTIRPGLEAEGCEVELVAVERDVARVRIRLPQSQERADPMGLLPGIQRTVLATVDGIRAVVNQDLVEAGYSIEQLAAQMRRGSAAG